jgi:hypothetical protein
VLDRPLIERLAEIRVGLDGDMYPDAGSDDGRGGLATTLFGPPAHEVVRFLVKNGFLNLCPRNLYRSREGNVSGPVSFRLKHRCAECEGSIAERAQSRPEPSGSISNKKRMGASVRTGEAMR